MNKKYKLGGLVLGLLILVVCVGVLVGWQPSTILGNNSTNGSDLGISGGLATVAGGDNNSANNQQSGNNQQSDMSQQEEQSSGNQQEKVFKKDIKVDGICPQCGGTGVYYQYTGRDCYNCHGSGVVTDPSSSVATQKIPCVYCGGTGKDRMLLTCPCQWSH